MELPAELYAMTIQRGTILHSNIFEYIDHNKFFVVMGVSNDSVVGFFFINSGINHAIHNKPEQFALQYSIDKTHYQFLDHMSFINAASLIKIPLENLTKSISSGDTKIIDFLHDDDLNLLLDSVRKSKIYSKAEKRDYFY